MIKEQMTTKEIADLLQVHYRMVNQYICRGDFSHLERYRIGNRYFYRGLTKEDLKKLKYYIEVARKRSGHKYENKRRNRRKN